MNAARRMGFGILILSLSIGLLTGGVRADDKKTTGSATGTWKSTFTPQGRTIETIYKLKQEGEKLTGTATGARGREVSISDGKIEDGKVSFQVTRGAGERKITVKYQGKLSGDTIEGKVEIHFGEQSRSANWLAKREKQKVDK